MINFLLEEANTGTGLPSWVLLVVLGVLLVLMFVVNTKKEKRARDDAEKFMRDLKVGDKVRTYHGVYGTIVSITETTDGAIAVLETGDEAHKSYITMALAAVGGLDNKKDVVYDAEGNPIIPEEEQVEEQQPEQEKVEEAVPAVEETVEEKTEVEEVKEPEVQEEQKVEVVEEEKVQTEEKPKKKSTAKKTSTTTAKKTTKKTDK